jgi:hypothetical protein
MHQREKKGRRFPVNFEASSLDCKIEMAKCQCLKKTRNVRDSIHEALSSARGESREAVEDQVVASIDSVFMKR